MQPTGRPLGFDPEHALDVALATFWVHGYGRTSTTVLEEATGLSRSSLTNTFGAKDELLAQVLDRYQAMVDQTLLAPLHSGGAPAIREFFEALAAMKEDGPGAAGCLVVSLSTELHPPSEPIARRLARYRDHLAQAFEAALSTATSAGALTAGDIGSRVEALSALAVSVNWTARAAGPSAAAGVASAAIHVLDSWRPQDAAHERDAQPREAPNSSTSSALT